MSEEWNVPVTKISAVSPHPNADRLEIATLLGWQTCVQKGLYSAGDLVVYVPPDTLILPELASFHEIEDYLSSNGRVKRIRLRGEPSFGFILGRPENIMGCKSLKHGDNAADILGFTQWQPPVRPGSRGSGLRGGRSVREIEGFPKYTKIVNLRHYPDMFDEGELVEVTEKIHGANCRIGIVNGRPLAGSHNVRRPSIVEERVLRFQSNFNRGLTQLNHFEFVKAYKSFKKAIDFLTGNITTVEDGSTYWKPWNAPGVREMIETLHSGLFDTKMKRNVVVYGEIYGPKIQSLGYCKQGSDTGFCVFDIKIDGKYIDQYKVRKFCEMFGVEAVPFLGSFAYSFQTMKKLSSGKTILGNESHMREGVVVRPTKERHGHRIGRVIAKMISDEYLLSKVSDYAAE